MGFNLKEFLNLNNKEKQKYTAPPASTANPTLRVGVASPSSRVSVAPPQRQQNLSVQNTIPQQTVNGIAPSNTLRADFQRYQPPSNLQKVQSGGKTLAKPFFETGDYAVQSANLGAKNWRGDVNSANTVRAARDESYQQSIVPQINMVSNMIAETPVGNLSPGIRLKKSVEKDIESKLIDAQKQSDTFTTDKVKEISSGVKSGLYEPQRAQEAIQSLLQYNQLPTQLLDQVYNEKLQSAGFDKNMSKDKMYAKAFGNIASVASYGIAPLSGAALAKAPITTALVDVGANAALGGAGMGTMAYGEGASLKDSLKAGVQGAVITTGLVGLGYGASKLKNAKPLDEGGFIELGRTPKKIHPEDQNIMSDFIDYTRGVYKPKNSQALEVDASRIAERYGIKMPPSIKGLANEFDKRLTKDGFKGAENTKQQIAQNMAKLDQVAKEADSIGNRVERAFKLGKDGSLPTSTPENFVKFSDQKLAIPKSRMDKLLAPFKDEVGAVGKNIREPKKIIVYRSGKLDGNPAGIYMTDDKATAGNYVGMRGEPVRKYEVSPDAKLYQATTYIDAYNELNPSTSKFGFDSKVSRIEDKFKSQYRKYPNGVNPENGLNDVQAARMYIEKQISKKLKSKGYDGVVFSGGKGTDQAGEHLIFNKEKLKDLSPPKKLTESEVQSKLEYAIDMFPDKFGRDFIGDEYTKIQKNLLAGKPPYDGIEVAVKPKKSFFKPLGEDGFVKVPGNNKPIVGPDLNKTKKSTFAKKLPTSKEVSPELAASVRKAAPEYVPLKNIDQLQVSKDLIKKGYQKAATDVGERLDTELGKISAQDAVDSIEVIKQLDYKGGTANIQKATALSEKLSEHFTAAGQTVQAASILSNRSPEGLLYGARSFLKKNGIDITPEMQKSIRAQIDIIRKTTNKEDKLYRIGELQQQVARYVPSSNVNKGIALWKAGLLTGVKTQTGNTLSGIVTNTMKIASDAIAAPLDAGLSGLGKTGIGKKLGLAGERTKAFTLQGAGSGIKEGAQKGFKSLKTGIDERNLETSKFDTQRVVFSKKPLGRIAQRYTDTVYGMMGAADRPNYYMNLRRNLSELAIVQAKNQGLKGSARNAFIKDFISNPPTKALQTATTAAERAIFANDTQLSKWAGSLRKTSEKNAFGNAAINIVLPFTKVPSSIVMRMIDYSPAGAVKTLGKAILDVKKTGVLDQRAFVEGIGEAGIGTGALFLGFKLKEANLMTGSYPKDQKERELWKLEGKQPNSIKVGDKWHSINYTSPGGQVIATGSKLYDAYKEGQRGATLASTGLGAGVQTLTEQSFLKGAQGALDLISDPIKEGPNYVKNLAGSIVPTLVNDMNKASDPIQRQVNNPLEAIKGRLPGVSKTLLPKQDAFGDPIPRASSSVNTLFNPFRPSDIRPKTDLNSELRRLQDIDLGVMPDPTDKSITFGSKDKGNFEQINLTPQQVFDKNSKIGGIVKPAWEKLIKTPEYAKFTNQEKHDALAKILTDARALGKSDFASKTNPGLLDKQKLTTSQVNLAQDTTNIGQYTKLSKTKTKENISNKYSTEVQDFYNLTNAEKNAAFKENPAKAQQLYDQSKKYENELVGSGVIKKAKSSPIKSTSSKTKSTTKTSKAKTKGSSKGNYSTFSTRTFTGLANTTALRSIVKQSKITRKRIKV